MRRYFKHCLLCMTIALSVGATNRPAKSEIQESTAFISPQNLASVFTFTELTTEGPKPIKQDRSIIPIDINSIISIKILPKPLALGQRPVANGSGTRPTFQEISKQREELLTTLKAIDSYLSLSQEVRDLFNASHDSTGKRLLYNEEFFSKLEDMRQSRSSKGRSIVRQVKKYIAISRNLHVSDDILADDFEQRKSLKIDTNQEILNAMHREDIDFGRIEDPGLAKFIQKEVRSLDKGISERIDKILSNAKKKLRLKATLRGKGGRARDIHLPGYDTHEAGMLRPIDKLSFHLNEQQKDYLTIERDFSRNLNVILGSLHTRTSDVRGFYANIESSLEKDVEKIFSTHKPEQLEKKLIDPLMKLSTYESIQNSLKEKLDTLKTRSEDLVQAYNDLQRVLQDAAESPSNILTFLSRIKKNKIWSVVDPDSVKSIPNLVKEITSDQTLARSTNTLKETITDSIEAVRDVVKKYTTGFRVLREKDRLGQSEISTLLSVIDSMRVDDPTLDIPFNEVTDTEISVLRTARENGDFIDFSAQVVDEQGKVLYEYSKVFEIVSFGFHTNIFGNLVLVDRRKDDKDDKNTGQITEREVNFVTFPAVSYLFQYKTREKDKFGKCWNFLNPGIGANAALLNFEGSDIEMGIGFSVSLFGGIVQGGYGYNLQVDDKRDYYFIGLDIFEPLRQYLRPQNSN